MELKAEKLAQIWKNDKTDKKLQYFLHKIEINIFTYKYIKEFKAVLEFIDQ